MNFNVHSDLKDKHALLSPSGYHWINYEGEYEDILESLRNKYQSQYSQYIGTVLHEYAEKRIKFKLRIGKHDKKDILFYLLDHGIPRNLIDIDFWFDTVSNYVNDAIGYKMQPEVLLYHSDNCFGTTDTISFSDNLLRIHDLKTGRAPAHIEQLEIYAALFCLEYKIKPEDIRIELRIYQANEVLCHEPEAEEIIPIMEKIVYFDKVIDKLKEK